MLELVFKARKFLRIMRARAWWTTLCRYRVAAGVEHVTVLQNVGQLGSIVDVGANRGQFALVARQCFPAAQIISFEPLLTPAGIFQKIFADDDMVVLHEAAIGPEAGEAIIHLAGRDDSSSLLPITTLQNMLFPGTAEVGVTTVKVVRLSDCVFRENIAAPALLKLDVQGFELQALVGCEDILGHFSWVYVECSFIELYAGQATADSVIAWLREQRFALVGVYHISYDKTGGAVQADFLFRRIDENDPYFCCDTKSVAGN